MFEGCPFQLLKMAAQVASKSLSFGNANVGLGLGAFGLS